jgi:hypothetical protein
VPAINIERNFGDLSKIAKDLSDELNKGIKIVAKDIEQGIEGGGQFGRRFKRNHPITIENKGFDHPLKETGLMMNHNKMKYVKATKSKQVAQLAPNSERVDIAYNNDRGTKKIPSRPFWGISDEAENKVMLMMEKEITRRIDRA